MVSWSKETCMGTIFMLYSAAKTGLISEPVSATRTICFIFFSFPLPLIRLSRIILHGFPNYVNGFHKLPYFHKKRTHTFYMRSRFFIQLPLPLLPVDRLHFFSPRAFRLSAPAAAVPAFRGHPPHLRAAFPPSAHPYTAQCAPPDKHTQAMCGISYCLSQPD